MSKYNAIKTATDANIKANGRKEITGPVLNAVLNAIIDSLGKYYQFVGLATPSLNPGTPDQNVAYVAVSQGTYEHFGGLTVGDGELTLLTYDGEWRKATVRVIPDKISQLSNDTGFVTNAVNDLINYYTRSETYTKAEVDQMIAAIKQFRFELVNTLPTASADTMYIIYLVPSTDPATGDVKDEYITIENGGVYSWEKIGRTTIDLSNYPTRSEMTTAINNALAAYITGVSATVDNNTGIPSVDVSFSNGTIHLAFHNLKGAQGNTGSSVDYPFTLVNNVITDDATQALTAAMGKYLQDEISQLEAEVDGVHETHYTEGGYIKSDGTVASDENYAYSDYIPVSAGQSITLDYGTIASNRFVVVYNTGKSKIDYWSLTTGNTTKNFTTPANTAYMRFAWTKGYNAKAYANDVLFWQAIVDVDGLEDRVSDLESDVQTLSGEIDSVKDDVSKIAVDKNTIDYGIKAGYAFSRTSGTPMENITVSDTETGINIAKTGGTNLSFKIILSQISEAGTYHIVFSSNKEMTSASIYKDGTYDSSVQATDNVCEFDYVYDGTYVLAIGTTMLYDKSSQDYSLVANVPNATGMSVIADNISERVQELEDSAQTPIPASVEGTNTFIGDGAGQSNTPIEGSDNGKYNTAVGKNAMRYNTLGDHNTAFGFCALNKNQDGRNNTALGEDALYENLHGGQNVAIGQHSGQDSQGAYNVFIGSNAARRQATGDLNVVIGAEAYNDNAETGCSGAVLIGAYASNPDNYDNVIVIKGEAPTAAKQIRIGKADFSAFIIGNKKLNFNNDGTVTWEDVTPTP